MLIKFFPNGKGGGAGPVNYLTARTVLAYDENRDLIRDASGQTPVYTCFRSKRTGCDAETTCRAVLPIAH
jgi:hypothetical protein